MEVPYLKTQLRNEQNHKLKRAYLKKKRVDIDIKGSELLHEPTAYCLSYCDQPNLSQVQA